jgi:redox-sensitive bicupin YhaK (pirin superfamily)
VDECGRGIVHAESSLAETEEERTVHGIQLWTSLPRLLKSMEPRYQRIDAASIPTRTGDGVRVRTIAGTLGGDTGPAQVLMPLVLAHITLDAGARFEAEVDPGFELAGYVMEGAGRFGSKGRGRPWARWRSSARAAASPSPTIRRARWR